MDDIIRIAAMVAAMSAAEPEPAPPAWPGEDRFRHVAMSWAVTSFTFAAARAAQSDNDTALAIALPVSAAVGIGKELVDRRDGGAFSAGDLVADVVGMGLAYFILREVH